MADDTASGPSHQTPTDDAPLHVQLQAIASEIRRKNPAAADIIEQVVAHVRATGTGAGVPKVGEAMPPFLLPDQNGRFVALADLLERGPVVVAFHRGVWCPYCRTYAAALARLHGHVRGLGGEIVAITPSLERYNRMLQDKAGATFPVLTDLDHGYALQLDLAFRIPEDYRTLIQSIGWDLAADHGNEGWLLPIPATFVVGRDGRIRTSHIDPDYRSRMGVEDIITALSSP